MKRCDLKTTDLRLRRAFNEGYSAAKEEKPEKSPYDLPDAEGTFLGQLRAYWKLGYESFKEEKV